jgi:hypothetical protein
MLENISVGEIDAGEATTCMIMYDRYILYVLCSDRSPAKTDDGCTKTE